MQLNPLQPGESNNESTQLPTRLLSTDDALVKVLARDYPKVALFFCLMGQLWPESDWSLIGKVFQYAWSGMVRFFLLFTVASGIYFCVLSLLYSVGVYVFIGVSISLQAAVLIPSIFAMNKRLYSKCGVIELDFFVSSIGFSCVVLVFSIACGLLLEVASHCVSSATNSCEGILVEIFSVFSWLGQLAVSCILALNTLFVLVDSQVSVKLVKELIDAHNERRMSISMFNEYRADIKRRVKTNYWTYNSVLFIAVFNILLMIIIVYFHESSGVVLWPIIFIKEIPFVLVALYYSTAVHEQADKLTKLLGTTVWSSKDIEEDYTRLFYFTNAEAEKISFPLSGMRLKKKDLLLRVATSSLAFVLGLLRSALANG